ncbi:MAG: hypothetical protein Terrestrivirus1_294 [Terrestrivirus sp.]|uniref:Uncharacterized protein n=1 Tax=Terrestrivirus sp. TaxID=2487775 RepID=A0A3G4ZKQ9_9VIRU|nr:MAG: hypothetical protein Terrestrivirus1_294 [Terrestrivirus sp.]
MSRFIEACKNGNINTVKKYLSNKKFNALNEKESYGCTPFHLACYNNHIEIVELLIKANGFNSLNEKNNYGYTPFHYVCCNGHIKIVELLMKTKGFNSLNEKDNRGNTPFNLACSYGRIEIVETLLKCHNIIVPDIIKTENDEIKELVERYKKDPEICRSNLILKGHIDLYRSIVFLCDEYYKLNEETENKNGLRFMKIASKLPLELQMILIYRLSNSSRTVITSKQFDENIMKYVEGYLLKN